MSKSQAGGEVDNE